MKGFNEKEKIIKLEFSKNDDFRMLSIHTENGKKSLCGFRYNYDDIYVIRKLKEQYELTKDQIKFIMQNFTSGKIYIRNKVKWEEYIEWMFNNVT